MSILINKNSRVITQGITGKTGQFHTRMCRDYANGKNCFVAGVNPKKAGEDFEGIPIFASVKDAAKNTGATVSVIYVPPPFAAAASTALPVPFSAPLTADSTIEANWAPVKVPADSATETDAEPPCSDAIATTSVR